MLGCVNQILTCPTGALARITWNLLGANPFHISKRQRMKNWIKEYFSNTAFNPYKRQIMPCTEGLHLKIYSYVGIHKQVAVPLHFREAVLGRTQSGCQIRPV